MSCQKAVDIIRNNFASRSQLALAHLDAQVVQATGHRHYQVREVLFGVAQCIFYRARALHPGQRMFDPHPDPRQGPIVPLLALGQAAFAGLFFGWRVCSTAGS